MPPSSFHTGTPSDCPIKSQQATSNDASADCDTSPGRSYSARWIFQASRSTSNGSVPMTCRGASSSRHAISVSVRLTILTSLIPTRPESLSSSRNTSSRQGVPTTIDRAETIFMSRTQSGAVSVRQVHQVRLGTSGSRNLQCSSSSFVFLCSLQETQLRTGTPNQRTLKKKTSIRFRGPDVPRRT